MNRLTNKYKDGSGYEPIETNNVCNLDLYDFNYNDYECCVNKLGKLEDIMEEYDIDSVEELDNVLSAKCVIGGMRSSGKTLINKGILYNKISEQLGCPLEVIFKAFEEGVLLSNNKLYKCRLFYPTKEKKWTLICYKEKWTLICHEEGESIVGVKLSDYQKTWWLKGEKINE